MAIDKKLIHFENKEKFISHGVGSEENITVPSEGTESDRDAVYGQIKGSSIVFIKDSKEIWTHGNLYKSVNWSILTPPPLVAGNIVYYTNGSLKTVKYTDWKNELGTPVGVITIPKGFAPDGKARMVALSGQTSTTWSTVNTDTSLTNYTEVPITDNAGSTSTESNLYGFLPSDKFTGATSFVDSVSKYSLTSSLIPSPYAGDAPNPEYYKSISEYNNVLSDFSGLENTQTLVELDSANHQAANHCWTYSDGVSTTQWYLPAMGELGYIMPRYNEINAGLAAVAGVLLDSNYYWSSSEHTSSSAYYLNTIYGRVDYNDKDTNICARPWAIVE